MATTIGHELIELEKDLFEVPKEKTEAAKKELDEIIECCKNEIKYRKEPEKVFRSINRVLKNQGYTPHEATSPLYLALLERTITLPAGVIIYLSVGETENLPFYMVRHPRGIFLRWDKGIFWDVLNGKKIDEDVLSSYIILNEEKKRGLYFRNLNRNEAIIVHLLHMGAVLDNEGRYDKALECMDKILKINDSFCEPWYLKGLLLLKIGKFEDAERCFDRAIERNEYSGISWHMKAVTLLSSRNPYMYLEAIECLDKAIELYSGSLAEIENRIKSVMESYHKNNKIYKILSVLINGLDKAIEIYERIIFACRHLGAVYETIGRKEIAAQYYLLAKVWEREQENIKTLRDGIVMSIIWYKLKKNRNFGRYFSL